MFINIILRFVCNYRISHFGSGVNNRSKKKIGGSGEIPEDEIMLVEDSSWYNMYISVIPRLIYLMHETLPVRSSLSSTSRQNFYICTNLFLTIAQICNCLFIYILNKFNSITLLLYCLVKYDVYWISFNISHSFKLKKKLFLSRCYSVIYFYCE